MPNAQGVSPSLTLDELRRLATDLKEDLQRKANQGIRKKDWEQGISSLASMEAIDEFLYTCELRARVYAATERESPRRKPGANVTTLPQPSTVVRKRVKTGADPETLPGWARERVKG